jgi:hypothetical protein
MLQRDIVEYGIGKHALELAILIYQGTQLFGFRNFHPAKFGLPFVNAGIADAMLAA